MQVEQPRKSTSIPNELSEAPHESLILRSQLKNDSGYLPSCYETAEDFPELPPYHFRIEDDQTILQLQQLYRDSSPLTFKLSGTSSENFNRSMDNLANLLDQVVVNKQKQYMPCQTHGYYSMTWEDYNHDLAMQHNKITEVTGEMRSLTLSDPSTHSEQGKQYVVGQKRPKQCKDSEKQVVRLTEKMGKLDISEY